MKLSSLTLFALITLLSASDRNPLFTGGTNRETTPYYAHALFAGGCFWGVQAAFGRVNGVVDTAAGYTGGSAANPTYRAVSLQTTGHAEAVRVTYDPARVSYAELLDVFWGCHDPSADPGESHRSAIFYFDQDQEITARESLVECEKRRLFAHRIRTQIMPATRFYPAEDEHQHYIERLGGPTRCQSSRYPVHTKLAEDAAHSRVAIAVP